MNKESDIMKLHQIQLQLKRINRSYWLPTLTLLIHHFEGAIEDERHNILDSILEVLKSLHFKDSLTTSQAIQRFQKMFCFNYRFYKGKPAVYWDPTKISYTDFAKDDQIFIYEGFDSHPAPDILMRWFAERFEQDRLHN